MYDADDEHTAMPQPRRFRLIPLTVIMLGLLFVIKVNEVYIGSRQLREFYAVRDATASDKADAAKTSEAKKEEKPADKKEVATDKAESKDAAKPDDSKKEEAKAEGHGEPAKEGEKAEGEHGAAKPPEEPKTYGLGKSTVKEIEALKDKNAGVGRFSKTEVDLLENLSKRRDELDQREKDLEMKTKVLDAAQKRIDDKLAEMKVLDTQLSKTVATYNEKQDMQIASLVKIYESMKPAQAATIFNELDLPILLEVIDKMSERRVAPVLALMDPKKAKDVTQELAAMRKSAPKVPPSAAK